MSSNEQQALGAMEPLASTLVEREEIMRLALCGSTKFRADYELWNKRLSLAGFLVYSVSGFGHSGDTFTPEQKARLDRVHLAKIDSSHAIVVINPGGYVGESTQREIEHAKATGKSVYYTDVGFPTVYQLRTGPDGASSQRYRAFGYTPAALTPTDQVEADGDKALMRDVAIMDLADHYGHEAAALTPTPVEELEKGAAGDQVEIVAKAIYDATHAGLSNCYDWNDRWEDHQEARRDRYYKEARAAIAALAATNAGQAEAKEAVARAGKIGADLLDEIVARRSFVSSTVTASAFNLRRAIAALTNRVQS